MPQRTLLLGFAGCHTRSLVRLSKPSSRTPLLLIPSMSSSNNSGTHRKTSWSSGHPPPPIQQVPGTSGFVEADHSWYLPETSPQVLLSDHLYDTLKTSPKAFDSGRPRMTSQPPAFQLRLGISRSSRHLYASATAFAQQF
jgi:hypothetical protein